MARVNYVEKKNADAEVLEIYEKILNGSPRNSQKVLAHRPRILKSFINFFASVGQGMERRLYELAYIRVSILNGCNYCMQHHLANSVAAGLNKDDWMALKDPARWGRFTDKEKAALALADKITLSPSSVRESDIETLRSFFSDGEIVEITVTIALANLTNRITGPLGIEFESPEREIRL